MHAETSVKYKTPLLYVRAVSHHSGVDSFPVTTYSSHVLFILYGLKSCHEMHAHKQFRVVNISLMFSHLCNTCYLYKMFIVVINYTPGEKGRLVKTRGQREFRMSAFQQRYMTCVPDLL